MYLIKFIWYKIVLIHVGLYFLLLCSNYSYSQGDTKIVGIESGNKWAFADINGNALTPFIYDEIYPANTCSYQPKRWYCEELSWFYKGSAVVKKDSLYTILNTKMQPVVPWDLYQWISPMSIAGLMIVKQNNKYGLINHRLEHIQKIEFDTISNSPANKHEQNYPSFWAMKDGKYYILDTLGNWENKIAFDNIRLLQANYYLVTKDTNTWRFDRFGNRVIEDYTILRDDENGFIARKGLKYGLVDIYGDVILPFEYEDIISEHLGNIFVKKNGKWGVVDENNHRLLDYSYDYIEDAWNKGNKGESNYIVVQNDKFGAVTNTGKEIFPCLYDGITTWVEYGPSGHYVMIGERMGLIDYKGKVLIPIQFQMISCLFGTSWAEVYDNNKMGIYDIINKSFFLPLEYDFIYVERELFGFKSDIPKRIVTYKSGVLNILDINGKVIHSNVPKKDIKAEFDIDIDSFDYENSLCTYELHLMRHNRSFRIPACLLNDLNKSNSPIESIYYNMENYK